MFIIYLYFQTTPSAPNLSRARAIGSISSIKHQPFSVRIGSVIDVPQTKKTKRQPITSTPFNPHKVIRRKHRSKTLTKKKSRMHFTLAFPTPATIVRV